MRGAALALVFATGFTGLVDEVAWQRALAALIGSHGEAAAAVLAIFLGGLALGYAAFGRLCRAVADRRRLLRIYGAVEASIGVLVLSFPWLFEAARAASLAGPGDGGASFARDLVLTALLLGPPTFLMGGTLPLLTQALARDLGDATRLHALVYGWNAAGGFAGALAAGFFLVPGLGIPVTLRIMGAVNVAAGATFAALAGRLAAHPPAAPPPEAAEARPGMAAWASAALLLGFAMLALQTVVIRVCGIAFGASDLTFAVVVATFVLCLALGSLSVALLPRLPRAAVAICPAAVALLLVGLYPLLEDASWAAHRLRVAVGAREHGFLGYELATAALILGFGVLPLGLAGASLPVLFHVLRRRIDELGRVVGRLYGWNTLGSVLGALLGGHALLYWLDLHHVYRIAVAAVAVAAALLAWREARWPAGAAVAAAVAALAGLAALPAWHPANVAMSHLRLRVPEDGVFRRPADLVDSVRQRIRFADDDPTVSVLVHDYDMEEGGESRALLTQGKSDGSLSEDYPTMALAGLVPCVLAERCTRAFVIGLGLGVTAGELATVESMERVTVAEISSGVIAALPLFDHGNQGASTSPKIEIVRGDALRALLRRPGPFDVIASEPSHPWASGVERLYALEFLEAARTRLAPGGVYAQWMHVYEMDDATLALVLRTFATAFGEVAVWWANGPDLLLLGFAPGTAPLDAATVLARAGRPDLASALARAGVDAPLELLAHELVPAGVLGRETLPGPVHTLLHPRLARRATRAFFHGWRARVARLLPLGDGGGRPGLLASLGPLDDGPMEAVVRETCASRAFECATLLARWRHERPGSPRPEQVRAELEAKLEPHLLPARIDVLAALYGEGLLGLEPVDARRLTDHYRGYYHAVFPFRPEALDRSWEACRGDGCAAARRAASWGGEDGAGARVPRPDEHEGERP